MPQKKNKFEFASEEVKTKFLNEIIGFFQTERDETIGVIAAEEILEFFVAKLGEEIYRKAVDDCKKVVKEKNADMEFELDTLATKA